jgi:DNA mismatch repair protein MutS2
MNQSLISKLEFDKIIEIIKNYCISDLGREMCEKISPSTDAEWINNELDKVIEMKNLITIEGHPDIALLKDVRNIVNLSRVEGSFITADKLLWILDFLKVSRIMKNYMSSVERNSTFKYYHISEIVDLIFHDRTLEHNIESSIDESGEIKDSASLMLKKIRAEKNRKSDNLRKSLTKILKSVSEQDLLRDEIITLRDGRSVIPVRIENKRKVPGIIHSTSSSGATVYIEPSETIEINNEITELYFEEQREIERILRELTKYVAKFADSLLNNCILFSEIEFLYAKAKYSLDISGEKPEIKKGTYNLVNAYHPLLLRSKKKENVTPLNFQLPENINTIIITGPNAGGKTVTLKTLGLLQLMLQCGFTVPCREYSSFNVFDNILISIDDQQSIENNLSSFSSHLKSLNAIIEESTNNSLILIDEICAGTDPSLGSALSKAILNYLKSKGCISVVTTHMGDLKGYAYEADGIENASMEFNSQTFSPDYNFVMGLPGQSFTFEIAEKFNTPEEILKEAKNYLTGEETSLENLLKDLNDERNEFRQLKLQYQKDDYKLKNMLSEYEDKMKNIRKTEKESIVETKRKAEEIIRSANSLIENTIKEIRERKDIKPRQIKDEFSKQAEDILNKIVVLPDEKKDEIISNGDTVRVKGSNGTGRVVGISKDTASVELNGIVMKVKLKDLEKTSGGKSVYEYSETQKRYDTMYNPVHTSLDLRGSYPEEVEDKLFEFLNDAKINGLHQLKIIHGKGTGKLRQEVRRLLSGNKTIKSMRYGNWNEGDSGVTIIEI